MGFRIPAMYRMIAGLTAAFDHLTYAMRIPRRLAPADHKIRFQHMVGATGGYKNAFRLEQFQRAQVDFLIAAARSGERLAVLRKGGRVEIDYVKRCP